MIMFSNSEHFYNLPTKEKLIYMICLLGFLVLVLLYYIFSEHVKKKKQEKNNTFTKNKD